MPARSLGIDGTLHQARHVYGTQLLRSGANLRIVQELMRHRSISSTEIYTAVSSDERTDAIRRLGAGLPAYGIGNDVEVGVRGRSVDRRGGGAGVAECA